MKTVLLHLFVAFSLLFAPVAQASGTNCFDGGCHNAVSVQDAHHHEGVVQLDEHAKLDVDAEGKPHNGASHNHSHHHGNDSNPAYSEIDLASPFKGSAYLSQWNDNSYFDHCASPLLEPPSRA